MDEWIKRCEGDQAMYAIEFNRRLSDEHALKHMRVTDEGDLAMERLDRHPSSWSEVEYVAVSALWEHGDGDYLPMSLHRYQEHCVEVTWQLRLSTRIANMICDALDTHCQPEKLTPVKTCHGDLTLENVMYRGDVLVFIDPGYHRGLPCRELDRAKLLQSHDGWHQAKTGHRVDTWPSMPHNAAVLTLLMTHYLRILRHNHPLHCKCFAEQRMRELLEIL